MTLNFEIDGELISWKAHAGYGKRSFNPLYKEREFVQWQLKKQYTGPVIDKPIHVDLIYFFPIPKSVSKKKYALMIENQIRPAKRPDIDNLNKFYIDAMKEVVFKDDQLVVQLSAVKFYGPKPKVICSIEIFN